MRRLRGRGWYRQRGSKSRDLITCVTLVVSGVFGTPLSAQDGEALAKTWCSSCHTYPDPQLLDRDTWVDFVLPQMGARLGFESFRGQPYGHDLSTPDGVYATEPLMEHADWDRIISFYEVTAPDQLELPDYQNRTLLELFDIEVPESRSDFPTSTAVLIDETARRLLVGDSFELDMEVYSSDLTKLAEIRSGGAISRILDLPSGGYLVTTMGGNIGQAEHPFGLLLEIMPDGGGMPVKVNRLARDLHRPVNMVFGDFNDDGRSDYVVAGFGTHSGKLSLHLSQPDGRLRETTLLHDAGATSLAVDGDDLLVLVAQGDERVVRLENFVSAHVTEKTVLRFAPSQGSSSMNVLDINGDGLMDLLYTAGDNADISPIYKPYHGVYIFYGQADGSFQQGMFFHLDGATSAVAEDFDLDGDLDIAAIAYYANTERNIDETTFVFLENTGGAYVAKYIDGIGRLGRFVAMSAGDIDGDGDSDIALANMAFGPYGPLEVSPDLQHQWLDGPPFVLLRNNAR